MDKSEIMDKNENMGKNKIMDQKWKYGQNEIMDKYENMNKADKLKTKYWDKIVHNKYVDKLYKYQAKKKIRCAEARDNDAGA